MRRFLELYLNHHRLIGSSPKTIRYHQSTITLLIDFLKRKKHSLQFEDFKIEDARLWIADQMMRGLSDYSVRTRIRSISAWCRWLLEEEWIETNPLAKLKTIKVKEKHKDVLRPEDVDRLLKGCDRKTERGLRDYAIMMLLFSTGLRAAELVGLNIDDIHWADLLITIRRGKGGKVRPIPLGPKVGKALQKYIGKRTAGPIFLGVTTKKRLTTWGLHDTLERRGATAGINAHPHSWRHSAAIAYLRNGGKVHTLRTMLGHSSYEMTLHYARLVGIDLIDGHVSADPTLSLESK